MPVGAVTCMTIWGNHSDTQYPDYKNARINGKPATEVISDRVVVHRDVSSRRWPSAGRR